MNQLKSQTIRLSVMLALTFSFFVVELVVGNITGSLALVSDSYHMLSDFIALFIGLACVRISQWDSAKNTYGWVRAEVLGALINSVFLIALCFTIVTDAITRLISPETIEDVDLLLYVGIAGLGINVFGLFMFCSDTRGSLHGHSHGAGGGHSHSKKDSSRSAAGERSHGHSHGVQEGQTVGNDSAVLTIEIHPSESSRRPPVNNPREQRTDQTVIPAYSVEDSSPPPPYQPSTEIEDEGITYLHEAVIVKSGSQMNMLGVFLHVLGDALGSVVVIISALIIKFVNEPWVHRVDPAMSIVMSIIILSTTIPLFKQSAMVLLQTVPTHIKIAELQEKLLTKVNEITGLHEFHVWQLTGNRIVASGHMCVDNLSDYTKVALKVKSFFHDEGIHSTTFQPEFTQSFQDLKESNRDCFLECGPSKSCFENTCCSNKHKRSNTSSTSNESAESNPGFHTVDENNARLNTQGNEMPIVELEDYSLYL